MFMENGMTALRTAVCATALGLLVCAPVTAATLKNGDKVDHKLTIVVGDKTDALTVKAGARIEVCPKSCTIKIEGKEDFKADSPDVLWIQSGGLVKSLE
jgi:hypothetical protein